MQLDPMGAVVNPYRIIVAYYLETPCCFGFVYLSILLVAVVLLHRSSATDLQLAILNLSDDKLTLLLPQMIFQLLLYFCDF